MPPAEIPTQAPTATVPATHTITMTATGSIAIDTAIQKAATGESGYAFGPLFTELAGYFTGDINLATLENLVIGTEKLTDVNMPADALAAIRDSGVNVLCNGFYGALSSGMSGLSTTMDLIRKNGMTPYGLYLNAENRNHAQTVTIGDVTVALLSFQSELSAASKKQTTREEQDLAVAPLTLPAIGEGIAAARAAGAQIVVVSLCWGKEGAEKPTATQQELAQGIASAGADIILGTHSGKLQTVEVLTARRADGREHKTLCAYSLGNLLISGRSDRSAISGALLHITMRYSLANDSLDFTELTFTPTYVFRGRVDGRTAYRVLVSNVEPPAFVGADQRSVMERSLSMVRDKFAGSQVTEAP
jgi:poly-gamma-glutamate synthesis protein (capsule biosynthesis protein)